MRPSRVLGIVGSLLVQTRAAEVTCYAPDGQTIAPNDSYVPCNKLGITQQGVFSTCCLLDGDPASRDLCATSGLCVNGGVVRREFCTDQTWKSPACVGVCLDPAWGGSSNSTVELTPCTDGKFCCGHNNLTCCGTQWAISVPTQATVVAANSTTVVTETATPNTMMGIATIAGLGGALGLVLLLSLGIIFFLKRKNSALEKKNEVLAAEAVTPPGGDDRLGRLSFMPSSGAPTMVTPSTHVPSMQEFAAFKAIYGAAIAAQQNAPEAPDSRLSELDASTIAAARHFSHQSQNNATGGVFEQIREVEDPDQMSPPTAAPGTYDPRQTNTY